LTDCGDKIHDEDDTIKLLIETLSCMIEFKAVHSAARLREGKSSLTILDCLLALAKLQGK